MHLLRIGVKVISLLVLDRAVEWKTKLMLRNLKTEVGGKVEVDDGLGKILFLVSLPLLADILKFGKLPFLKMW